jgi:MarR family transcriptional regulator, lower aerobic nicotinate degradation pathway regulator
MQKRVHPIYGRPGHLVRRLQQIAVSIFMSETDGFNTTPVQYSALLAVEMCPGVDQATLANIIAFDRTTIGRVVSRLERKKWIKRVSSIDDRRSKCLTITPAGHSILRAMDDAVNRSQELILAPLRPAERRAFVEMLERLVKLNNSRSRVPLATLDEAQSSMKAWARD